MIVSGSYAFLKKCKQKQNNLWL